MIRRSFLAAILAMSGPALAACGGSPPGSPGCLSHDLNGSIGLSQATAGAVEVTLVFRNVNTEPCTLNGFPGVALAAGTPAKDVGRRSSQNVAAAHGPVKLAPGGFANATLQISAAGNYAASVCMPMKTTSLAVMPPNQKSPIYIPFDSTGCKGSPKLLTVSAFRPGKGG